MISILGSEQKYTDNRRDVPAITCHVVFCRKHTLCAGESYRVPLAENRVLFLVLSGEILVNGVAVGKNYGILLSRFSSFSVHTVGKATVVELRFDYSGRIPLLNEKMRVLRLSMEVREYAEKMYDNQSYSQALPGVNDGLMLNILSTLNLLCQSDYSEFRLYQRCYSWIDAHTKSNLSASMAAEAMSCSVAHLNRVVKRYSGHCLSELIAQKRIQEIKHLLKTTAATGPEIAAALSFDSAELLRKFFKYHTGVSLQEYRKRIGN